MVALEIPNIDPAAAPEVDADDTALLDAYSMAVSGVAEALIPSVASLRISRNMGGWSAGGVTVHEMARMRPSEVARVYLLEPPLMEPGVRTRLRSYVDRYRLAASVWQRGRTAQGEDRNRLEAQLRQLAEDARIIWAPITEP